MFKLEGVGAGLLDDARQTSAMIRAFVRSAIAMMGIATACFARRTCSAYPSGPSG
jgi:hypothetical protein